jgi:hypothetical protein
MSSAKSNPSVAAVVVTYNRLALLKECVAALRAQTRPLDEIIVVNNGSTDGTAEWLAGEPGLTVVTQENQGSSGGQATGTRAAYLAGHDWFWLMDDDTIPYPDSLQNLLDSRAAGPADTGFLSCVAVWTDGTVHRMNYQPPAHPLDWYLTVQSDGVVPVQSASFVALLVARRAVTAVGLPLRPMYLWGDDVEYTERIGRRFRGYVVTGSRVLHKTLANAGPPTGPVASRDVQKVCYGARNQMYLARTYPGSPARRLAKIANLLRFQLVRTIRRHAPVKVVWWCISGLWFRPRVEFPE